MSKYLALPTFILEVAFFIEDLCTIRGSPETARSQFNIRSMT